MKCLKNKRCVSRTGAAGQRSLLMGAHDVTRDSPGCPVFVFIPFNNDSWSKSGYDAQNMRYQWRYKIHRNYKWIYSLKWARPVNTHTDHLLLMISNHLLIVTSSACHQYYCSSKSLLISEYSQKNDKDKKVVELILQHVAEQNVVFLQFVAHLKTQYMSPNCEMATLWYVLLWDWVVY